MFFRSWPETDERLTCPTDAFERKRRMHEIQEALPRVARPRLSSAPLPSAASSSAPAESMQRLNRGPLSALRSGERTIRLPLSGGLSAAQESAVHFRGSLRPSAAPQLLLRPSGPPQAYGPPNGESHADPSSAAIYGLHGP